MALEFIDANADGADERDIALALRQAIEQAEKQGPVAWAEITKDCVAVSDDPFENATPLYTAPVDAINMKQERVDETAKGEHEYVIDCPRCGHCCPERKWVGLTENEIVELAGGDITRDERMIARAIEAKLKEKNG
jgi:hypothetical protein